MKLEKILNWNSLSIDAKKIKPFLDFVKMSKIL